MNQRFAETQKSIIFECMYFVPVLSVETLPNFRYLNIGMWWNINRGFFCFWNIIFLRKDQYPSRCYCTKYLFYLYSLYCRVDIKYVFNNICNIQMTIEIANVVNQLINYWIQKRHEAIFVQWQWHLMIKYNRDRDNENGTKQQSDKENLSNVQSIRCKIEHNLNRFIYYLAFFSCIQITKLKKKHIHSPKHKCI